MYENIKVLDKRKEDTTEISLCSGIGGRENQQDGAYFYADDQILYAVVCDGMGGLGGGELASQKAIEIAESTITEHVRQHEEGDNKSESDEQYPDDQVEDGLSWMTEAIQYADHIVYNLKNPDGQRMGAGTTFCSVCIKKGQLYWASVGDSRVYLIHGDEVAQLTTDLNYSFVLDVKLQAGEISEAEYLKEQEDGEALTTFVGLGGIEIIDRNLEPFPLTDGDIIVVCSDGMYKTIDSNWLRDILTYSNSLDEAARIIDQIIEEKNNMYQDNYTCFFIKIGDSDRQ